MVSHCEKNVLTFYWHIITPHTKTQWVKYYRCIHCGSIRKQTRFHNLSHRWHSYTSLSICSPLQFICMYGKYKRKPKDTFMGCSCRKNTCVLIQWHDRRKASILCSPVHLLRVLWLWPDGEGDTVREQCPVYYRVAAASGLQHSLPVSLDLSEQSVLTIMHIHSYIITPITQTNMWVTLFTDIDLIACKYILQVILQK